MAGVVVAILIEVNALTIHRPLFAIGLEDVAGIEADGECLTEERLRNRCRYPELWLADDEACILLRLIVHVERGRAGLADGKAGY